MYRIAWQHLLYCFICALFSSFVHGMMMGNGAFFAIVPQGC